MDTILGLIMLIGMLIFVVGGALYLTEIFSMHELKTHLHDLGINVYSTEKKIQNNLRQDNIGEIMKLFCGSKVIFTSEYKCRFASRLSLGFPSNLQHPVKGEIIWRGEKAKINARIPLGFIISLIGLILIFSAMPFIFLFGLSSTPFSEMEMVIFSIFPIVILLGIYFINFYISKKNVLRIVDGIIELVQPKNI
jgi:hypothetical protein